MPLQATSGAASYDAFGGGVAAVPNYIEDVFSTWLYTGNSSTQTITNGIDLAGKGGLVWIKARTSTVGATHLLGSSQQTNILQTSNTGFDWASVATIYSSFNSNGFSITNNNNCSENAQTFVSWTFRKQPKFFDVVTYTGNGANRTIAHNLGSVPGCIIVKRTDTTGAWQVYHRSLANTQYMVLNSTSTAATGATRWNSTTPTSTVFSLGTDSTVNASGGTYVAYLFGHDSGGFGLSNTDNVISCGSFETDAFANAEVTLGWEPQWILYKTSASGPSDWSLLDNMRGWSRSSGSILSANLANAEAEFFYGSETAFPTQRGFKFANGVLFSETPYIYIAIRRGPMKVPTTGTSVFQPVTRTNANAVVGTLQASDMGWFKDRTTTANWFVADRLRGIMSYHNPTLYTNLTDAEATPTTGDTVTAAITSGNGNIYFGGAGTAGDQPLGYSFRRAPGFFDEVCYTGNGPGTQTINHNLGVAPELSIFKPRSGTGGWTVYNGATQFLRLNETAAGATDGNINPTSSSVTVSSSLGFGFNASGVTYVAYLFATCPGVSKVGSYTGTGTTQTINCGFTAGSRFVMIKRTNSTGDWYVWDSARGIVAGNDPYLLLNSTAAEVTGTDFVDTAATGFEISSTAPAAINASGGTFIFFAVA